MQVKRYPEELPVPRDTVHNDSHEIGVERPVAEIIRTPSLWYFFAKRFLDVFLSLFGLIVFGPVFLAIGICIKLDDGGPVLHFREITGENGRRFYALKFRTMTPDADTYLGQRPELLREYQKNMK